MSVHTPLISEPSRVSSGVAIQSPAITVNYWTEHSSGTHYAANINVSPEDTVLQVITQALSSLQERGANLGEPEAYVLRFANKKGLPKTDMPKLAMDRIVCITNFSLFTLCEVAKEKPTELENLRPTESLYEVLEPPRPDNKRSFFCCFSAD